ncbi:hypothetical protein ES708_13312 [subsurface metagenome]
MVQSGGGGLTNYFLNFMSTTPETILCEGITCQGLENLAVFSEYPLSLVKCFNTSSFTP